MTSGTEMRPSNEVRGRDAAMRADELRRLGVSLKSGESLTSRDIESARYHAQVAHARARRAHLAAADRHVAAAEAHNRAADTHRRAADAGIGDVATHWRAVAVHEAARDDDYRAAELARRLAHDE